MGLTETKTSASAIAKLNKIEAETQNNRSFSIMLAHTQI